MQQEEISANQKVLKSLNNFLVRYGKILIILSILILTAIISIAVSGTFKSEKNEKSALAIEAVQDEYIKLKTNNTELSQEDVNRIISSVDSVIKEYPSYYAEQRGLFFKGNIYFEQKDFEKAAESYKLYSEKYPDTYLTPISLYNTAVCYEEQDKKEDALKIYESIKDKYSTSYPDMGGVLFSIGRLSESLKNYDTALASYTDIVDNYSNSGWTNFARDRIIYLKASNFVK